MLCVEISASLAAVIVVREHSGMIYVCMDKKEVPLDPAVLYQAVLYFVGHLGVNCRIRCYFSCFAVCRDLHVLL